ncbi:Undecaprenyl-phosphate galactose phosphotransferase WbaP/exopolysaccharide biosynthesis polyprenyl glycosylphosphotransferase [Knoellia remsis]|uniref:Undecaprenyl-phosphate galactose phosphotransferase WbaP/exopolysaccharide biosynthesis polyprenyl glycosylphosphotransferase n=1 Tax=Knoellia remsis TaxID=407159 RepID=A0A2T0UZC0_9MICO|nr:sugar transferase [Knoellia remsis]PRY63207.1 Undecaprenyl-phosphate galactose phosphotransferase WbaP/exopolysaccharide biosynthesis polyprenyl glycosylphosphotransferase [Knoellia remsis]
MLQLDELRTGTAARGRSRAALVVPSVAAALVDTGLIIVATFLAAWGRRELRLFDTAGDLDSNLSIAAVPIVALWLLNLGGTGAWAPHLFGAGSAEYKHVLRASVFAAGWIGIACYLTRFPLSRGFFFLLFVIGVPLLLVGRYALRATLHVLRRRGHLQQKVVLAGTPRQVDEIAGVLHRERWLGLNVLGAVVPTPDGSGETPRGLAVLGPTARTGAIVTSSGADVVLFAGGAVTSAQEMRRAVWELEETGVNILISPSLTDVASDRVRSRPAAGLPLLELEGPSASRPRRMLKRVFDVTVTSMLVLAFAPVLLVVALLVKLGDGGPVLFTQQRVGRQGRPFGVLKFRSMVVGADTLTATMRNKHDVDHVLSKDEDDPRITRVGRVIRRYSLDELPQLFNVLRGDMSLVGPRPPLQTEVDRYDMDVHRRLTVLPGMTGLWQVSGRADLSWEDSVRLDLYYVDNWSMTQDLLILARTVHAVVSRRGAY